MRTSSGWLDSCRPRRLWCYGGTGSLPVPPGVCPTQPGRGAWVEREPLRVTLNGYCYLFWVPLVEPYSAHCACIASARCTCPVALTLYGTPHVP